VNSVGGSVETRRALHGAVIDASHAPSRQAADDGRVRVAVENFGDLGVHRFDAAADGQQVGDVFAHELRDPRLARDRDLLAPGGVHGRTFGLGDPRHPLGAAVERMMRR
jgi:hypothetical protein